MQLLMTFRKRSRRTSLFGSTRKSAIYIYLSLMSHLLLTPVNPCTGVLRNVRFFAGARKASTLELPCQIVNNIIMMLFQHWRSTPPYDDHEDQAPDRTHALDTSPSSTEAEKEAEVYPPHVKAVRVAKRAITGRGGEGCGVCAIVVKPSSWGRRSNMGRACLLFLEEGRS
jgi:hypothetical protein